MTDDFYNLGSAPVKEPQKGTIDDVLLLKTLMLQRMGPQPDGAYFHIERDENHKHSLHIVFDPQIEEARDYAIKCRRDLPEKWPEKWEGVRIICRSRGA